MSIVPVKINSVQPQISFGDVNYNNSYITDIVSKIDDNELRITDLESNSTSSISGVMSQTVTVHSPVNDIVYSNPFGGTLTYIKCQKVLETNYWGRGVYWFEVIYTGLGGGTTYTIKLFFGTNNGGTISVIKELPGGTQYISDGNLGGRGEWHLNGIVKLDNDISGLSGLYATSSNPPANKFLVSYIKIGS